jgi:inner membrane protein
MVSEKGNQTTLCPCFIREIGMNRQAHITTGALVGTLTGLITGNPYIGLVAGAIGGYIPDIDHPGSFLGFLVGHRTITHKVEFVLAVSLVAAVAGSIFGLQWVIGLSLFVGGISHLLLDACTKSGIQPFLFLPFRLSGPLRSGNILIEVPLSILFLLCTCRILGVF